MAKATSGHSKPKRAMAMAIVAIPVAVPVRDAEGVDGSEE